MRWNAVLIVIGMNITSSGCGIIEYTAINSVALPARCVNQCRAKYREREAADHAWKQIEHACPEGQYSADYAKGFKRGFAQYLDANGDGQPPGAPPLCYRCLDGETPAGNQAVRDWYAGYSHGMRVAQETGIRSWIIVPPSDMLRNSVVAPFGTQPGSDGSSGAPSLPAPRKVSPESPETDASAQAPSRSSASGDAAPRHSTAP